MKVQDCPNRALHWPVVVQLLQIWNATRVRVGAASSSARCGAAGATGVDAVSAISVSISIKAVALRCFALVEVLAGAAPCAVFLSTPCDGAAGNEVDMLPPPPLAGQVAVRPKQTRLTKPRSSCSAGTLLRWASSRQKRAWWGSKRWCQGSQLDLVTTVPRGGITARCVGGHIRHVV